MKADQRRDLEIELAKKEARKRFRSAVRLECAIAADYVIGIKMPELDDLIEQSLATGGNVALDDDKVRELTRRVAKRLTEAMEGTLDQAALEAGE